MYLKKKKYSHSISGFELCAETYETFEQNIKTRLLVACDMIMKQRPV